MIKIIVSIIFALVALSSGAAQAAVDCRVAAETSSAKTDAVFAELASLHVGIEESAHDPVMKSTLSRMLQTKLTTAKRAGIDLSELPSWLDGSRVQKKAEAAHVQTVEEKMQKEEMRSGIVDGEWKKSFSVHLPDGAWKFGSTFGFNEDGREFWLIAPDTTTTVFSADNGKELRSFRMSDKAGHGFLDPKGEKFVVITDKGEITIGDSANPGANDQVLRIRAGLIANAKFVNDGGFILTTKDGDLVKLNTDTGALVERVRIPVKTGGESVGNAPMTVLEDSSLVATALRTSVRMGHVAIWDKVAAARASRFKFWEKKPEPIYLNVGDSASSIKKIILTKYDEKILTLDRGYGVFIWDPKTGKRTGQLSVPGSYFGKADLIINQRGVRNYVVFSNEGQAYLYDADSGKMLVDLSKKKPVYAAAFADNAQMLVTASDDRLTVWYPEFPE